jgi:hypothetical protein
MGCRVEMVGCEVVGVLRSSESTTVNTAIMVKTPIVTPVNERMVRNGFTRKAFTANLILSNSNLI